MRSHFVSSLSLFFIEWEIEIVYPNPCSSARQVPFWRSGRIIVLLFFENFLFYIIFCVFEYFDLLVLKIN